MLVDAKRRPIPVRMVSGRPTARNSVRKTGFASWVVTVRSPWHVSTDWLKWSVMVRGKQ